MSALTSLDERLLAARAGSRRAQGPPRLGPAPAAVPLSAAQRAMARAEADGGGVTHFVLAYRIRGLLDTGALERAITELHRRHAILRTVFPDGAGHDGERDRQQMVLAAGEVPIQHHSFTGTADPYAAARNHVLEVTRHSYSPRSQPPVRWWLLEVGEHDHILVLWLHHLLADAASERILEEDLAVLYQAFVTGTEPAGRSSTPVQYADFVLWEQRQEAAGGYEANRAYWRSTLKQYPSELALPFDRAPYGSASYSGATLCEPIPADLVERVRALARSERASEFMVHLTAYALQLRDLGGVGRMVLGTPMSGRGRPELERVVGLLADLVPLPIDVSGELSFRSALDQVRGAVLDAMAYQDVPFDLVAADQSLPTPIGRRALIQSACYHYEPAGDPVAWPPELRVDREQLFTPVSSLDLSLAVETDSGTTRCLWEYRRDLFDAATISGLHERHLTLLARATESPDAVPQTGDPR
ncbi:hypothetical protein KGQ19_32925 [Catenulispora sp. NL8]|uniref:Condensation domain-containing protein n=1 Tax=Catenulispora pinistramenti TaxID=2705254 RepID=A0ABS5L0J0_9ACTN|nr:condensation domain-containing protein [Catenulispora pinistramenti]MBS2551684.1 hypothetical protein [Catenulispora pinistramenti]